MQTHVIISYDGTDNDHDALALGRIFGDAGARVSLAYVRHATESDAAAERRRAGAGRGAPRGRRAVARPSRGRRATSCISGSTGEGLWALAEREHADLVVFGSDWHTAPGPRAARAVGAAPDRGRAGLDRDRGGRPARPRRRRPAQRSRSPAARSTRPRAQTAERARRAAPGRRWRCPRTDGLDLLVVGSRPGTPQGRVDISAAAEYLVETATASVLIVARGVAFDAGRSRDRVTRTPALTERRDLAQRRPALPPAPGVAAGV